MLDPGGLDPMVVESKVLFLECWMLEGWSLPIVVESEVLSLEC